jgi:hypothetical protein
LIDARLLLDVSVTTLEVCYGEGSDFLGPWVYTISNLTAVSQVTELYRLSSSTVVDRNPSVARVVVTLIGESQPGVVDYLREKNTPPMERCGVGQQSMGYWTITELLLERCERNPRLNPSVEGNNP